MGGWSATCKCEESVWCQTSWALELNLVAQFLLRLLRIGETAPCLPIKHHCSDLPSEKLDEFETTLGGLAHYSRQILKVLFFCVFAQTNRDWHSSLFDEPRYYSAEALVMINASPQKRSWQFTQLVWQEGLNILRAKPDSFLPQMLKGGIAKVWKLSNTIFPRRIVTLKGGKKSSKLFQTAAVLSKTRQQHNNSIFTLMFGTWAKPLGRVILCMGHAIAVHETRVSAPNTHSHPTLVVAAT